MRDRADSAAGASALQIGGSPMTIICVDDEKQTVMRTAEVCSRLEHVDEAISFTNAKEALEYFDEHNVDIAILDIVMPQMTGIKLAALIKEKSPQTAIIFLTTFPQYAMDAFTVHATGYMLKPLDEKKLLEEIRYALSVKYLDRSKRIVVQTFGGFDVFVDGQIVAFKQKKCKELLALLVDRRGNSITRAEAYGVLYEDSYYDRPAQKKLDSIIRSMRETLREYGIEEIFEMKNAFMRIIPKTVSCDMYRFYDGDVKAFNSYRGVYMNSYSWANMTEGILTRKMEESK